VTDWPEASCVPFVIPEGVKAEGGMLLEFSEPDGIAFVDPRYPTSRIEIGVGHGLVMMF
jgi:hypothetical protein